MRILAPKSRLTTFGCLLIVVCCTLQTKSALAVPVCADVLTELLENLATQHRDEAVRFEAGKAWPSVPAACDGAGSIVDAATTLLARLGEDAAIRWTAPETSSRINSLVEPPIGTVVLTLKPPGSDADHTPACRPIRAARALMPHGEGVSAKRSSTRSSSVK